MCLPFLQLQNKKKKKNKGKDSISGKNSRKWKKKMLKNPIKENKQSKLFHIMKYESHNFRLSLTYRLGTHYGVSARPSVIYSEPPYRANC